MNQSDEVVRIGLRMQVPDMGPYGPNSDHEALRDLRDRRAFPEQQRYFALPPSQESMTVVSHRNGAVSYSLRPRWWQLAMCFQGH